MPDEQVTIRLAIPTDALGWCHTQGIERVALHASSMVRPLYESLGFAASNAMALYMQ